MDDWEWNLYLNLASSCVSDEYKLGKDVDEVSLDNLARLANESGMLTIIERLLVASDSRYGALDFIFHAQHSCLSPREKYEQLLAIRYLGGILELPSFRDWNTHQLDANHGATLHKLFELVGQLIQDIEVESPPTDDALKDVRADLEGVDILAAALVTAAEHWKQHPNSGFTEMLCKNFGQLVELLLQYVQYPCSKSILETTVCC